MRVYVLVVDLIVESAGSEHVTRPRHQPGLWIVLVFRHLTPRHSWSRIANTLEILAHSLVFEQRG